MADVQKTIELLVQFKEAGQEIINNAQAALQELGATAEATGAKVQAAFAADDVSGAAQQVKGVASAMNDVKSAADQAGAGIKAAFGGPEIASISVKLKDNQSAAQAFGDAAVSNFNAATASAEQLLYVLQAAEAAQGGGSGGGAAGGSIIGGINAAIGRSSELGGFLRLLAGSGPLLAITLILDRFKALGQAVDELSAKFSKGEISQDQFVLGVAKEIPIIGSLITIFADVADAITGEQAALDAATESWKKHQEVLKAAYEDRDRFIKAAKDSDKDVHSFDDQAANFSDQASTALLPDGEQKQLSQAFSQYVNRNNSLAKQRQDALSKAGATPESLAGLQKDLNAPFQTSDVAATIQQKIDAATQAAADINAAATRAFSASDDLFQKTAAGIKIQAARDETKKLGEQLKTDWSDVEKFIGGLRDKISAQNDADVRKLQEDAKRVTDQNQTPQQKYDAASANLDNLRSYDLLPPGVYDQAKAKLQKDLDDGNAAVAKALDEKKLKQDEYNAAIQTGVNKQIADAQTSYDRDVASWHDAHLKKEITQDQFNQYVVDRTSQMNEDLYQIQLQKRQAGQDVQLAGLQANHDGLGAQNLQIQMDYEKQVEQLRQQYQVQGLLSEQQYNDAILALDKSTEEKRLLVNGSFVDGVQIGFEKLQENIQSQAQIGEQVAADFANGFGDAFGQIVTGTKSVGDAFRDMAASILGNIAKLEAQSAFNAVLAPILAGVNATIGGAFGSLFSGVSGAPGLAGAGDPVIVPGGSAAFANAGGFIARFAQGDMVGGGPWGPDRDSVPALLTPGEFVVRRSAVSTPGVLGMLRNLNAGMPALGAARSAAASLGRSSAAARSSTGGGGAAGGSSTVVMPAVVANDTQMRSLLDGGRNATLDWLRTNYRNFAPRGGK